MKFHGFLHGHTKLPAEKRKQIPLAWGLTVAWFLFGIGPFAVIGNWIFGEPGAGRAGWLFGIPSIWVWQILFWLLGIALLWFLAYHMEMATMPKKNVEALTDDVEDAYPEAKRLINCEVSYFYHSRNDVPHLGVLRQEE